VAELVPAEVATRSHSILRQIEPLCEPPWVSVPAGREREFRDAAVALTPLYEAALTERITLYPLSLWIGPVAMAVTNPPPEHDLHGRLAVMAEVLTDLPIAVLTVETRKHAMRTWKFWPSVAEVFEFLNARAQELFTTLALLERIAKIRVEPYPEEASLTAEQRQQVALVTSGFFSRFRSNRVVSTE
jgi:hypothetical protein